MTPRGIIKLKNRIAVVVSGFGRPGLVLFFFQNFGYRKVHSYNANLEVSLSSLRVPASLLAALAILAIAEVTACGKTAPKT
jgi:hypothetical protein